MLGCRLSFQLNSFGTNALLRQGWHIGKEPSTWGGTGQGDFVAYRRLGFSVASADSAAVDAMGTLPAHQQRNL